MLWMIVRLVPGLVGVDVYDAVDDGDEDDGDISIGNITINIINILTNMTRQKPHHHHPQHHQHPHQYGQIHTHARAQHQ